MGEIFQEFQEKALPKPLGIRMAQSFDVVLPRGSNLLLDVDCLQSMGFRQSSDDNSSVETPTDDIMALSDAEDTLPEIGVSDLKSKASIPTNQSLLPL